MRSVLFILGFVAILLISVFSGTGCANIIPPSGGPKDTLAPVLGNATPADSTLNFRANRIVLQFDEYVDLKDVQKNLLFTPTFENNPQVDVKLRTVTIRLRDTLEPNTTYRFNFGDALVDINESNPLRDFTYTFSTGSALDSLTLSGKVILAETGRIDSNMVAVLYRNLEDSAVAKERPRYIAKLNGQGVFTFQNLPAGTFALYAWGDATARRYLSKTQVFAFADSPVVITSGAPQATLYAYKETPTTTTTTTPAVPAKPATGRANGRDAAENRLRFSTNLKDNRQDLLDSFVMTFEQPLRLFDSTKLSLTTDSTFSPVFYTVALDSTRRKLSLQTAWKESALYNLILDRDFAEDSLGRKLLKTDTLSFTARKRDDYGSLNLRFRNIDTAQNPVLQFIQSNNVVFSAPISAGTFYQELFLPGDYELRILYDRNRNGKWDPGQFFGVKRQPEIAQPIERRISVKPGFENEFELTL